MATRPPGRGLTALARSFLMALVVAACAGTAGSSSVDSESPSPTLTAVPGSIAPTAQPTQGPTAEPTDAADGPFAPPEPVCPAPAVAVAAPRLLASVGGQDYLMNEGTSIVSTCSTSATSDAIPVDPTDALHVVTGDLVHVALPTGWHFLYWEGWDRAPGLEGANLTPGGRTPDQPTSIDVAIPSRTGASIIGINAWVLSSDGRVVANIEGAVLLER